MVNRYNYFKLNILIINGEYFKYETLNKLNPICDNMTEWVVHLADYTDIQNKHSVTMQLQLA